MTADTCVILMAKQPRPGRTKTRLCPPFTPESAARFYEAMLRDTLDLASSLPGSQLAVAITPPEALGYFQTNTAPGTLLLPVEGADIGECLERALAGLLDRGFRKAIALNTDGPSLPPSYLVRAAAALDEHDLVYGPGEDGGYYLVGLKQVYPSLFRGIPWSTGGVLARSLEKAAALQLYTALTPPWYDVDSPADAERLRQELDDLPPERLRHTRRFFAEVGG